MVITDQLHEVVYGLLINTIVDHLEWLPPANAAW